MNHFIGDIDVNPEAFYVSFKWDYLPVPAIKSIMIIKTVQQFISRLLPIDPVFTNNTTMEMEDSEGNK